MTEFVSVDQLKQSIGVPIGVTMHDTQLTDITSIVNDEIDMRLRPYLGDAPIENQTESYVLAVSAALRYGRSLWYERLGQLDRAKHSDEIYKMKMDELVKSIRADKPDRTISIMVRGRDPLHRIYDTFGTDQYITREFL